MEVGACHDGLCDPLTTNTVETGCGVGDCEPAHQVGTFSNSEDDLHIRGILQIVNSRNCPAT